MRHGTRDAKAASGRGRARRGIMLLEVLLAAAILATAVLALAAIADRCVARDASGGALLAASRVAERLVADAEMRQDLRAASDQGPVAGLPGATYTRHVTLVGAASGVCRIVVDVSYDAGGRPQKFSLEKYVIRPHAQ